MRRRDFIAGLGGAPAWPFAARAQQPVLPVIGFVHVGSADAYGSGAAAFRKGLGETGYVGGQNVTVGWKANSIACRPLMRSSRSRRSVFSVVAS
jgi:putative tryptophan/tyrosine transport system substrate-binding protein